MTLAGDRQFPRFLIVGGAGFLADAGALALFLYAGLDPVTGRLLSIAMAMLLTWRLNRAFTFTPSERPQWVEGTRYALVVGAASAVNWLVYSALLIIVPGLPPHAALAVGSIVAIALSYAGFSRFAFR